MDIQTWLIPLLSLVGGAGGAAIINTLYGIKKQKQDRIDEHARWLRDRKLEVYSEFLRASYSALERAPFQGAKEFSEFQEALQSAGLAERSKVDLIAPREVSNAAGDVHTGPIDLILATIPAKVGEPGVRGNPEAHTKESVAALSAFTVVARKDLEALQK